MGRCKERILLASRLNFAGHQASPHIGVGGVALIAKEPPGAQVDCIGDGLNVLQLCEFPYSPGVEIVQLFHNGLV